MAETAQIIFKIVDEAAWSQACDRGRFDGAAVDLADGFIHFSTAQQVAETAAKHFAGRSGLLLAAFDGARFGTALKYEASRGGALFPHLYGTFDPADALWVKPLPLNTDGRHQFPDLGA